MGILFIFCFISVILFPINNNSIKNSEVININNERESFNIKTASNNPPNKGYFKYYKIITIPHEHVFGTGTHSNFPVLINAAPFTYYCHLNPDERTYWLFDYVFRKYYCQYPDLKRDDTGYRADNR